jgi:phosphoribosylamine---glycine ligase
MRVLVIGSGAREHALAVRISQDPGVEVHAAPGNGGMAALGPVHAVDVNDPAAIVALARSIGAGLVVVGPEAPLVEGAVDALREAGIDAFGPSAAAARLEGSKIFSKEFMARHGIPTAGFRVFDDASEAEAYVREAGRPLVVKADGLAAGKGVTVAKDADEAAEAIDRIMRKREFGDAGERVLVEETLVGEEVSYHVVSDGTRYIAMAPAQDHKRAYDGDLGPNTGGMGAYSPPPVVTPEIEEAILRQVVEPTLRGMRDEGAEFRGALFVGLMIVDGTPQVLEYNVRFGDPECEALMLRWKGEILPLFRGVARGDLSAVTPAWEAPCALCVVLAAGGYPGAYEKGKRIEGLDAAAEVAGVTVFHAGTRKDGDAFYTAGGRVLTVTAIGDDIDHAAERAYEAVSRISFEGMQHRRDIGHRARTR